MGNLQQLMLAGSVNGLTDLSRALTNTVRTPTAEAVWGNMGLQFAPASTSDASGEHCHLLVPLRRRVRTSPDTPVLSGRPHPSNIKGGGGGTPQASSIKIGPSLLSAYAGPYC